MLHVSLNNYGKLGLVISSLLLTACNSNDDDPAAVPSKATVVSPPPIHTVFVYMVGSDLESKHGAATADINEMLKVGSTQNLNIIITTGGANKDGWKEVKRFRIPEGTKSITSIKELTPLDNLGDKVNMGEASSLQNFLDWGMKTYKADKYSVIFWDHGGGAVGGNGTVGNDENKSGDALSLKEIDTALKAVTSIYKTKFELIGFDTCLMATLETATIASAYGNYMVASEELEPGTGWDYSAWLGAIKNKPTISTIDLSKVIIDSYYNSFSKNPDEQKTTTLSAIQLNKIATLNNAVDKLALKLGNNLNAAPDSVRIEIGTGREKSESYGKEANSDSGMIDLLDFASKLPSSYSTETNNIKTALADAVFYNKKGAARPQATGLSIYLPDAKTISASGEERAGTLSTYKSIGFLASWTQLVESYMSKAAADKAPPTITDVKFSSNILTATITGSGKDVDEVNVLITVTGEAGSQIVVAKEEVDEYVNNKARYVFNGKVALLNGKSIYVEDIESYDDNSGLVGIPAQLDGQQVTIYVQYEVKDDTLLYDVLGALPQSFEGAVARLIPINVGATINPLFQQIKTDGSTEFVEMDNNSFKVTKDNLTISIGDIEAGSYNLYLQAKDLSGNTSATDTPIVVTVGSK